MFTSAPPLPNIATRRCPDPAAGPAHQDALPGGDGRAFDTFPRSDGRERQRGCFPVSKGARLAREKARLDEQILSQCAAGGAPPARTQSPYGLPGGPGLDVIRKGRETSRKVRPPGRRKV